MKTYPIRERWEAFLLRFAAFLLDRGVQRSRVVSRRDNNHLFEMPHELRAIARRIRSRYNIEEGDTHLMGLPEDWRPE